jgi:hypothetical protein
MPWPIRYHEQEPENPQPGDVWSMRMDEEMIQTYYEKHVFSEEYLRDWKGRRPPLMICLPGAGPRILDQRWKDNTRGWTITGEPPNLTASPSIDIKGKYHGWLQNGVLSDDVEGRVFPT